MMPLWEFLLNQALWIVVFVVSMYRLGRRK